MQSLNAVLTRYRDLLQEVDEWFSRCSLAAGDQITCTRGCSACCRGLFDITLLDAFLLRDGFDQLPEQLKQEVINRAKQRLESVQSTIWQDFNVPWLLNVYPEEEWEVAMPDEDETPCPLLGADGLCLVYHSRPMTCRLHGVPLVDTSGEVLFDEWCSLNFVDLNPLELAALRAPFNDIFKQEQLLFREFTHILTGTRFNELDTMIPAAVLIDFSSFIVPEPLWNRKTT